MRSSKTFHVSITVGLAIVLLSACAARPQLIPRSAEVPAGIDFSGQWQRRVVPSSRPGAPADAEPRIRIPPATSSRNQVRRQARRSRSVGGAAAGVFLESGDLLKITQTASGLFISFDRAVVEEYSFGENRVVSVGPIEAQRVSGWQGTIFVAETLDDDGAILAESWTLTKDGSVLVRTISLTDGDEERYSSEQRFDRL